MEEHEAQAIADALGGDMWQTGGDIWIVVWHRADGKVVAISGDAVCLYAGDDAFDRGDALSTIEFFADARTSVS